MVNTDYKAVTTKLHDFPYGRSCFFDGKKRCNGNS